MTNQYDPQDDRLPPYGEAGHGQAPQPGAYGQPQPGGYGPPPGTYGGQQPGAYDAPQPGAYDAPQPGAYGGQQPGPFAQPQQPGPYGQSQAGPYGQPQPGAHAQPQPGSYGQPRQPEYGQSQQGYGSGTAYGYGRDASAAQPYGTPAAGYGAPSAGYGAPSAGYEASPAGYGASPAGYQPGYSSPSDYASWLTRVAGNLVDAVPQLVLVVIAIVVLSAGKGSSAAVLFALVFYLAALGVAIYNRWIRAGRTGQSWGKQVVGVRLIDEETRQPIGAPMAFVRDLAHIIDGLICYIGYLFPLWDQKRQTIADKMVHTIVVPVDEPYSPQAPVEQRGYGAQPLATGQYPQNGYPGQGGSQAYPQRPGYSQGSGYTQGAGYGQGAAFPGGSQESPYQYGSQNNGHGPAYPQDPGYPQSPGHPQGPGHGGQR